MSSSDLTGTISRMREVLSSNDFESETQRKAALRRELHQATIGLEIEEVEPLVAAIRSHFPDRTYESTATATELTKRTSELETDLKRVRDERDELRQNLRGIYRHLDKLYAEIATLDGQSKGSVVGGAGSQAPRRPEELGLLIDAVTKLISFATNQETIAHSVEESIGRRGGRPIDGDPLTAVLRQLARSEGDGAGNLENVDAKLKYLGLVSAALMAGVNQSWRGGTREVLEYLDPNTCEKAIPTKLPGLRDVAILKEVKRRFEEFWGQLDSNVAHYYRGTFEKVYTDKMEERR